MSDDERWSDLADLCATCPFPSLVGELKKHLPEITELEIWLWDYQRRSITAVVSGRSVELDEIDSLIASADLHHLLVVQGQNLGLLTLNCVGPPPDGLAEPLAALLAVTIRAGEATSETIARRQRRDRMSLPAEMQWTLLPPTQFSGHGASVSAAVEPAYDTGGDVFDYALDGHRLFAAVLDARGHGLRAATTASVATSAMRTARRQGADLVSIAGEIAASVGAIGVDFEFVSAVLVELDLTTWEGSWLSAGHLPPLVVDDDIAALDLSPALPLGLIVNGESSAPRVKPFQLRPAQSLVLYSDGIIENAALDDGMSLGDERFHRVLERRIGPAAPAQPTMNHVARSVVEELLALTGTVLRDDATVLVVQRTESR